MPNNCLLFRFCCWCARMRQNEPNATKNSNRLRESRRQNVGEKHGTTNDDAASCCCSNGRVRQCQQSRRTVGEVVHVSSELLACMKYNKCGRNLICVWLDTVFVITLLILYYLYNMYAFINLIDILIGFNSRLRMYNIYTYIKLFLLK